jgi:hypothetical protein
MANSRFPPRVRPAMTKPLGKGHGAAIFDLIFTFNFSPDHNERPMDCRRLLAIKKQWQNCHAFEVGGNLEFILAMVFLPFRRILQSDKCVDCVNQNFLPVSDTTDRPKFYFRIFVSNPPHIFLYHKALTKQRTDGHHELFRCSHCLFFCSYWRWNQRN